MIFRIFVALITEFNRHPLCFLSECRNEKWVHLENNVLMIVTLSQRSFLTFFFFFFVAMILRESYSDMYKPGSEREQKMGSKMQAVGFKP